MKFDNFGRRIKSFWLYIQIDFMNLIYLIKKPK